MLFGSLEIPDEVLEAQENGTLVIFAGAGISKDPPSNLPLFKELEEELVKQLKKQCDLDHDARDDIAESLSIIKQKGLDVHASVKKIFSPNPPELNPYHELIPRLFKKASHLRIVTTNFDTLLLNGINKRWKGIERYMSPALPAGDDFEGIVFLHGCVLQEDRRMVLTIEDFRMSYIDEVRRWASRFINLLFSSNYTIVFIGHSLQDTLFKYIMWGAKAKGTKKYAFAQNDQGDFWREREVVPIFYNPPNEKNVPHSELLNCLDEWVRYEEANDLRLINAEDKRPPLKTDLLSQRRMLIDLVSSPPSTHTHEDLFILRSLLDNLPLPTVFAENAKSEEWLNWVEKEGLLTPLLSQTDIQSENSIIWNRAWALAPWLADMGIGEGHIEALRIVQREGAVWNRILWFAVAQSLHYNQDIPHERFNHWVCALLAAPIPSNGTTHYLGYALMKCQAVEREKTALLLFEKMTHPNQVLKKPFLSDNDDDLSHVRWDIAFPEDDYFLRKEWGNLFSPNLNRFADRILLIAEANLSLVYNIVQESNFDSFDHHRYTIADSKEEDHYRHDGVVDVLIDAIRDCLQWMMGNRTDEGVAIARRYLRSNRALFQRLALYALANSRDTAPDNFISWILDADFITPDTESPELSLLLERMYPNASLETRIAVLNRIEERYQESAENEDDAVRALWMRQKILRHLATAAPTCAETARRWNEAKAGIPESELPTGIPGKRSGVTSGWVVPISPYKKDETLTADPKAILDTYDSLKPEDFWNRAPDRSGLESQIREIASENAGFGIRLAKTLTNRQDPNHPIWRSILQGWSNAPISGDEWEQVLTCLETNDAVIGINHDPTAHLLESAVENETRRPSFSLLPRLERLANILWRKIETIEDRRIIGENVGWHSHAINSTAGTLAIFWLHALSWRREEAGSEWKGLPDDYRNRFNHILEADTYGANMGQAILASLANFLCYLDNKWVSERLAPLFIYNVDESRAERAWSGFAQGRVSQPLVKILQAHIPSLFGKLSNFSDDVRRGLIHRISLVVYYEGAKWISEGLLTKFIAAIGEQDRVEFTQALSDFWDSGEEDLLKEAWDGWINEYIQARKSGKPAQFSAQEIGALADWVFPFAFMFDRFVETVVALPTPNIGYTHIFHRLKESDLPEKAPKATLDFFGWLLNGAKVGNFWEGNDVLDIVERLTKSGIKLIDLQNAIGEKCVELNLKRILELLDNQ